jgi:hypothetical protein
MKAWEKVVLVLSLIVSIACLVAIVKTNYDMNKEHPEDQMEAVIDSINGA